MKFEQGKAYNTIKTLGLAANKGGWLQLSQKIGQSGGNDVLSSENLTFSNRDNGKLWFVREDGTRVVGHPSHFDAKHAYNRAGEGPTRDKLATAKARVEKAKASLQQAAERLANIVRELGPDGVAQAEATAGNATEAAIDTADQDEAAELFLQG